MKLPPLPTCNYGRDTFAGRDRILHVRTTVRQLLHPLNVIDSMEFLLDKVSRTETNQEFLESMNQ